MHVIFIRIMCNLKKKFQKFLGDWVLLEHSLLFVLWTMIRSSYVDYRGAYIQLLIKEWLLAFYSYCLVSVQRK